MPGQDNPAFFVEIKMAFKEGHIPWNKGKKGVMPIPWNKGKIGLQVAWNKGRAWPEEIKKRMSKSRKGLHFSPTTEFKKGNIPWDKGIKKGPMSEEQKAKISKALEGRRPKNLDSLREPDMIRKALTRRTPTSLEEKFQEIVDKYNLPYKYVGDGSFMLGRKNPDFINTNSEKIAVEVYAKYYKQRDNRNIEQWKITRRETFKEYGWEIIFFDETEVNITQVLQKLSKGD